MQSKVTQDLGILQVKAPDLPSPRLGLLSIWQVCSAGRSIYQSLIARIIKHGKERRGDDNRTLLCRARVCYSPRRFPLDCHFPCILAAESTALRNMPSNRMLGQTA